jgi:hypothetical protein
MLLRVLIMLLAHRCWTDVSHMKYRGGLCDRSCVRVLIMLLRVLIMLLRVLIMLLRVLIMLLRNRSSTLAGGMARGGSGLRVGVRAGRVREIGAGDLVC